MIATRSWLFVPGDRPDRFARAWQAGADVVIVDLEDAVAPDRKEEARAVVAAWLAPERPVFVRVNGSESPWFTADVAAICRPGLAGIMLPKAEDAGAIRHMASALASLKDTAVLPLVETGRGLWLARRLARASTLVERLAFGSLDLALDLGMMPDADEGELLAIRAQLVLDSRVAGVGAPIDSVTPEIDDLERLERASRTARRLGFAGKLAIHPRQIATIHAAFTATAVEIAWARRVLSAMDANTGVARVDGVMVDRPLVERARRLLQGAPAAEP